MVGVWWAGRAPVVYAAVCLVAIVMGLLGMAPVALADQNEGPVQPVSAASITAGSAHTCVILEGGHVRCWGEGTWGQLGYGNVEDVGDNEAPASVGTVQVGGRAVAIAAGALHTCVILEGGGVRCWGHAFLGQLGYGNVANIGDNESPASVGHVATGGVVTAIAAGSYHTCAVLAGGGMTCWGYNPHGQLGYGDVTGDMARVGDNETPASVGLVPVGGAVSVIAAGGAHTCAVLQRDGAGVVRCWGNNDDGELGYGNKAKIGDNETPASVGTVDLADNAIGVTVGERHACATFTGGGVRCWGDNAVGQLGYAHVDDLGDDETLGSLATVSIGGQASAVTTGHAHTCAVLATRALRCWGKNTNGQLGLGHVDTIGDNEVPAVVDPVVTGSPSRVDPDPLAGPPETRIDDPRPTTTGATATIRYSSPDTDVAGYQCFLDGIAAANAVGCTGTAAGGGVTLTGLTNGTHTFLVRAVDVAGKTDPTPATHIWTVEGGGIVAPAPKPTGLKITKTSWRRHTITTTIRTATGVTGRIHAVLKIRAGRQTVRIKRTTAPVKAGRTQVVYKLRGKATTKARRATLTLTYPGNQTYSPNRITKTIAKTATRTRQ